MRDITGWTKPVSTDDTPMTQIQLLAAIAQQMAEQEQRLLAQEQRQTEMLYRLKAVEVEQQRFNSPCGHKYSIVGFANLQGLEISIKEASLKGRKASALVHCVVRKVLMLNASATHALGKLGCIRKVF